MLGEGDAFGQAGPAGDADLVDLWWLPAPDGPSGDGGRLEWAICGVGSATAGART